MRARWKLATALGGWLLMAAIGAAAVEKSAGQMRAEAFLQVLSRPQAEQRAFVQDNFTQKAIELRGLEALTGFLGQVRKDLGDKPPLSVSVQPSKVVFRMPTQGDEFIRFAVLLGPPPESKIDGLMLEPDEAPVAVAPSVSAAALPTAIAEQMKLHAAGKFSGAVLVSRQGKPLFAQAYGEADRASHRANTLDTPINLGSMNKMFTALVIAKLVEQGKLDWQDKVGQHLPDWPQAAVRDTVSIEHLLTHTSGLGQYWGEKHTAARDSLDTVPEYAALFAQDAPSPTPGREFSYSNNGFVLLGLIAEKVTGKDYYELVREIVYAPAGMTRSGHFRKDDAARGAAIGYVRGDEANTPMLALRGSPAGGGYSSANDLLRFADALESGRIVSRETLARMTSGHAKMGEIMSYGYGFGVHQGKERRYGHTGGAQGISASFEAFPGAGYTVIVLSNADRGSVAVAEQLGRMIGQRK